MTGVDATFMAVGHVVSQTQRLSLLSHTLSLSHNLQQQIEGCFGISSVSFPSMTCRLSDEFQVPSNLLTLKTAPTSE